MFNWLRNWLGRLDDEEPTEQEPGLVFHAMGEELGRAVTRVVRIGEGRGRILDVDQSAITLLDEEGKGLELDLKSCRNNMLGRDATAESEESDPDDRFERAAGRFAGPFGYRQLRRPLSDQPGEFRHLQVERSDVERLAALRNDDRDAPPEFEAGALYLQAMLARRQKESKPLRFVGYVPQHSIGPLARVEVSGNGLGPLAALLHLAADDRAGHPAGRTKLNGMGLREITQNVHDLKSGQSLLDVERVEHRWRDALLDVLGDAKDAALIGAVLTRPHRRLILVGREPHTAERRHLGVRGGAAVGIEHPYLDRADVAFLRHRLFRLASLLAERG